MNKEKLAEYILEFENAKENKTVLSLEMIYYHNAIEGKQEAIEKFLVYSLWKKIAFANSYNVDKLIDLLSNIKVEVEVQNG